jgi:tetratricopeptide (TPR) repeat protein
MEHVCLLRKPQLLILCLLIASCRGDSTPNPTNSASGIEHFIGAKELALSGRILEGKEQFKELLVHEPRHFGALRWLSRIALLEEEYAEALRVALLALSLDPDHPEIHTIIAKCRRITGAGNPYDHLGAALSSRFTYREALMEAAILHEAAGAAEKAKKLREEALAMGKEGW